MPWPGKVRTSHAQRAEKFSLCSAGKEKNLLAPLLLRVSSESSSGRGEKRQRMTSKPRIFFLNLDYYLSREIPLALRELGISFLNFRPNELGIPATEFLHRTTESILRYRPDLVLTVNALGLDEAGQMAEFFRQTGIPLAVWFVDSPDLFICGREHIYPENRILFSCDPHGAEKASWLGGWEVHYLPLAADKSAMRYAKDSPRISVSFVGESWTRKIAACHRNHDLPAWALKAAPKIARSLADDLPVNAAQFIRENFPRLYARVFSELGPRNRNGLLHLVYWRANKLYRKRCLEGIMGFEPLVAGDEYWQRMLDGEQFSYHPPIAYGEEVFKLYRMTKINFACSSVQMSGAVTQRVFDVPAVGGFVLTDRRRQLEEVFEPGKEMACYSHPEEIPEQIRYYLSRERERMRIIKAARRRIGAGHTYAHRLRSLIAKAGAGR